MLNNNIIFDFDGVIADTSKKKSEVFRFFFSEFTNGPNIIDYHTKHKGISRYEILNKLYELENIKSEREKKRVLTRLNLKMRNLIEKIKIKKKIKEKIKVLSKSSNLFIASNAPHNELKLVVNNNKLKNYFISIYGSKKNFSKKDSIKLILKKYKIKKATYIGDTLSDYKIAKSMGLDFIGIKSIFLKKISNISIYESIVNINESEF